MSIAAEHSAQNPPAINEGDILRTAADIGRVLGLSPRAAYHLVSSGSLRSVKKIGGRYFASRSRLLNEVIGTSD